MVTSTLGKFLAVLIRQYQLYISPYKGFCCAHWRLTGEDSCSEYLRKEFAHNGFLKGFQALKPRAQKCRDSYAVLCAQKNNNKDKSDRNDDKNSNSCVQAAAIDCGASSAPCFFS